MGEKMNNKYKKMIKNGLFHELYLELKETNYSYSIVSFDKDFKGIDSALKFCFLLYLTCVDDSIRLRMLICDFLLYTDTFFDDIYAVIKTHLSAALLMDKEQRIVILHWIINNFYGHPDSVYNDTEMESFLKEAISVNPNDSDYLKMLNQLNRTKSES